MKGDLDQNHTNLTPSIFFFLFANDDNEYLRSEYKYKIQTTQKAEFILKYAI